jgi:hypothetical protein
MAVWRQVSMREAVAFIRDECGQPLDGQGVPSWMDGVPLPEFRRYGGSGIEFFDNGMAVACCSDWDGPYSEVTPDIDANPPQWFIYC